MANEEHLAILRQGVGMWNQWRRENPELTPDLRGADFRGVNLSRSNLSAANLSAANLSTAVLRWADLERSVLRHADLTGADLSRTKITEADLRHANFHQADLSWAYLGWAYLNSANLSGAILHRTILRAANLSAANLSAAKLDEADLEGADLEGANLERAVLTGVDLSGANLSGAVLNGAIAWRTLFANVDLHSAHGLDTMLHRGGSTIGIDTLYRSGGNIPESFLRGCGVPNSMIDYAQSLVAADRVIDYHSCFISYSSKDEPLARRLHSDLQKRGIRCWYAPHDLKIGESIIDGIDQGIRLHEKLLLILSESSLKSHWVEAEAKAAIMRERNEGRVILFPIRLDDAVLRSPAGWAGQVQERHIGDFCKWKDHYAYQAAFTRLLRDLKATPDG